MSTNMNLMGSSAKEITTNYLTLLVTQLQNQNPLEPMENQEMAGQLAQLSSLEQTEQLNKNFSKVLAATQLQSATALAGKDVAYLTERTGPTGEVIDVPTLGRVLAVKLEDNDLQLEMDSGAAVSADRVLSVGSLSTGSRLGEASVLLDKDITYRVPDPENPGDFVTRAGRVQRVWLEQGQVLYAASDGDREDVFDGGAILGVAVD